jgi:hypothetical protein
MGLCISKKPKYYSIKYYDYNEPMNSDGQYDYLKYDENNNYLIYDSNNNHYHTVDDTYNKDEESLYYSIPTNLLTDELAT